MSLESLGELEHLGLTYLQSAVGTADATAGYFTVWLVCGVTALIAAALLLLVVPKTAFTDQEAPSPGP